MITRREFGALAAAAAQPPQYIKGIGLVSFPREMPLSEKCELAREAGFKAIEIRCIEDISIPLNRAQIAEYKRTASNEGITLATLWASGRLYADGAPHDLDPGKRAKAVESLTRAIEAAAELGIDSILINAVRVGTGPKFMNRYEDVYKGFQEVLKKCESACAKHKVMLLPENVGNRFLLSPLEFRRFIDELHSKWFGVYFDVGNVLLQGYPQDWIPTLGSRIKRIHFKDFKFDGNYSGKMVELLAGDLDWRATMAAIRKIGYRGFIVDEWGAGPDFRERLRQSSQAIDKILAM